MAADRRIVIGLIGGAIVCVGLAVALAMTGTQVDNLRLEREDLEFENEDLRAEQETLQAERDALQAKVAEQQQSLDQLKKELERARAQQPSAPSPDTAGSTGSTP